jgi:hypothetical protein
MKLNLLALSDRNVLDQQSDHSLAVTIGGGVIPVC